MILAQQYLAKHRSPFAAYMALQAALMRHYMMRGGSEEVWCERIAPVFRARYARVFATVARTNLRRG